MVIANLAASVLPLPDEITRLSRVALFGNYKVKKNVLLNLRYVFEQYHSSDWAYDGQTLTSSSSFIGSGQTSPKYRVHAIGASVSYRFR